MLGSPPVSLNPGKTTISRIRPEIPEKWLHACNRVAANYFEGRRHFNSPIYSVRSNSREKNVISKQDFGKEIDFFLDFRANLSYFILLQKLQEL